MRVGGGNKILKMGDGWVTNHGELLINAFFFYPSANYDQPLIFFYNFIDISS